MWPLAVVAVDEGVKSRLLLQLAACCITGREFVSLRVHQPGLKWLIFQAENSKRRLQEELRKLWLVAAVRYQHQCR